MARLAAALLAVALAPAAASAGDSFADIARGIGRAAQRAGVQKVQLLPLVSVGGEATPEGRMIASRIMAELIDQGKVLVVEGDLPGGIPDPYRAAMGIKAKKNVRPEAEAVVLGTHMTGVAKIHVDVQLLRVKDRVVLFSTSKKVKNEWEGALAFSDLRPAAPPALEGLATAAKPVNLAETGMDEGQLSDALDTEESRGCGGAAVEVDQLQGSIMDIKTRYVARKLKDAGKRVHDHASTLIQDPELKSQFAMGVQHYLDSGDIPPLTRREIRTLLVVDGKSFEIHRRCLLDGAARLPN